MAKTPSGLPDSFDLNVTASDLAGPAALPGYLDEDPIVSFARMKKQPSSFEMKATPKTVTVAAEVNAVQAPTINLLPPAQMQPAATIEAPPRKAVSPSIDRKRFQINLDVASERMLEELLDLLSSQSSGERIKISELFQALLMTLYNAKGEIALGSLPTRGRWGSPTAKAFPVNLAESLREAIVVHERASGGNPFRKVVGG
ncbi:MAG: hypothetical protein ABL921_20420 [Pirellula sp.]